MRSQSRLVVAVVAILGFVSAACGGNEANPLDAGTSSVDSTIAADTNGTVSSTTEAPTSSESASSVTTAPGSDESDSTATPPGSDESSSVPKNPEVGDGVAICQFDPTTDEASPFGMRSFLRFEDREGGSAVVYESFGNAVGDGAQARQQLVANEDATAAFDQFLRGAVTIDDVLFAAPDQTLIDEIEAAFTCDATDTAVPEWRGYEQSLPGQVVATCDYDPQLGPNPLGMRATFTFRELSTDSEPILTTAVYEQFGNAAGDGAAWHQTVFTDFDANAAFEEFLSDPRYYSEATGDFDTAEVQTNLDLMRQTYTCA